MLCTEDGRTDGLAFGGNLAMDRINVICCGDKMVKGGCRLKDLPFVETQQK